MDFDTIIRGFALVQLKEVMKKVGISQSGKKSDLIEKVQRELQARPDVVQRIIIEMYSAQMHQAYLLPTTGGVVVPRYNPVSDIVAKATSFRKLQDLEMNHHQGLYESVRVVGAISLEQRHPISNLLKTVDMTPDEMQSLRNDQSKLFVRFMLYNPKDSTWSFSPIWPKDCKVSMNGEVIVDTHQKNRLGLTVVGQKDPSPAIDVSKLLVSKGNSTASMLFDIMVNVNATSMKWLVVVSVLKRKMPTTVLSEVLQRSPTQMQCEKRVKQSFSNSEGDVELAEAEISLKDPASLAPIKFAARGKDCLHLQCFDLFTYIEMYENARQPTWNCPLCRGKTMVKDLVTDSWFQNILNSPVVKSNSKVTKAQVLADASCVLVAEDDDSDDENESSDASSEEEQRAASSQESDEEARKRLRTSPLSFAPVSIVTRFGSSKEDAIELLDDDDFLF